MREQRETGTLYFANVELADANENGSVYQCNVFNSKLGTTASGGDTTITVDSSKYTCNLTLLLEIYTREYSELPTLVPSITISETM